ncbi:MAG: nitroreductase family protein [Clostridium perfringens]|nr:nitroreductase family protein [Clostridium perfringens]
MDFLELAKERYSVRKFSNKNIEKEKLDLILEAGRVAPTAANYQPQKIYVIANEYLEKLDECTPCNYKSPISLLVCYDSNISWKRAGDDENMGIVDGSIVLTHMMLEAANLGLGSVWIGHFSPDVVREKFNLPEHIVPFAIMPIGYPDENSTPLNVHNIRKDIDETVSFIGL